MEVIALGLALDQLNAQYLAAVVSAVASILALVIALWGPKWASRFKPSLVLDFAEPFGERTLERLVSSDGTERKEQVRYYHLRVTNKTWPAATHTQICLIQVESHGANDELFVDWVGELPMRWRLYEIHPLMHTVGRPADCDLFAITKDNYLDLKPVIGPTNLKTRYRVGDGRINFVVTLQARSNEGNSNLLRLRITWDGEWHEGDREMQRHLTVNVL